MANVDHVSRPQDHLVTLTLPGLFVGQVLDALEVSIEDWDCTYRFMESGECDPDRVIRECSSADEAAKIRDFYTRIRDEVERQLETQQTVAR